MSLHSSMIHRGTSNESGDDCDRAQPPFQQPRPVGREAEVVNRDLFPGDDAKAGTPADRDQVEAYVVAVEKEEVADTLRHPLATAPDINDLGLFVLRRQQFLKVSTEDFPHPATPVAAVQMEALRHDSRSVQVCHSRD